MELTIDAYGFARIALVADIDFACRVISYQNCGETRNDSVVLNELDRFFSELGTNLLRQFLTVEDFGRHCESERLGLEEE